MKKLLEGQIQKLISIGEQYKCKCYLPPIESRANLFYIMNDIEKDQIKLKSFMIDVKRVGIKHKFKIIGNKKYMEVLGAE